jgi:hypothetical protein
MPGAALFGTLIVAARGTVDPAATEAGLGVTAQVAPDKELTVQLPVTFPL